MEVILAHARLRSLEQEIIWLRVGAVVRGNDALSDEFIANGSVRTSRD